jgi:adenylate cyclase
MCAWTADEPGELNRRDAALASLAVVEAVDHFNAQLEDIDLNARVGLEEGHFYLGHTGGGGRMGYSILGDCANTAARLESLNKHLGTHVLATQAVVQNDDELLLRPLGRFTLVGKEEPIPIVEILAPRNAMTDRQSQLCERFSVALDLFVQQQWDVAGERLEAILNDYPGDGPSRFYLDRCQGYQAHPPADEDPSVIRMESK